MKYKLIKITDYILVVDDSEIKEGDYYLFYWMGGYDIQIFKDQEEDRENYKHLYNTTCKKIIAHLPLNGSPILEGVDLLPPIEDDVEQLASEINYGGGSMGWIKDGYKKGYNKAREKYKYTEEDLLDFANWCRIHDKKHSNEIWLIGQLLTKYQSLHQYPTEFECEMIQLSSNESFGLDYGSSNLKPKTITTAQGIQWVGKYK